MRLGIAGTSEGAASGEKRGEAVDARELALEVYGDAALKREEREDVGRQESRRCEAEGRPVSARRHRREEAR